MENVDAQGVYGYTIFRDDKQTCIKYPIEENNNNDDDDDDENEGKEKLAGRSFHNGRFVRRLRLTRRSGDRLKMVEGTVKTS